MDVNKLIEDILKINPHAVINEVYEHRIKFRCQTHSGYTVFLVYPKVGIYYIEGHNGKDVEHRERIVRLLADNHIFDQLGWVRNNIRGLGSFRIITFEKQFFEIVLFNPRDPENMDTSIGLIYVTPPKKEVELNSYEAKKIETMFANPKAKITLQQLIELFKSLSRLGFRLKNGDINIWMDWESELEEIS